MKQITTLIILALVLGSCLNVQHDSLAINGCTSAATGNPNAIYPAVQVVFQNNFCYDCHSTFGGKQGDVNLESYLDTIYTTWPGEPSQSPLFNEVNNGTMPPTELGYSVMSASDVQTIQDWIDDCLPQQ